LGPTWTQAWAQAGIPFEDQHGSDMSSGIEVGGRAPSPAEHDSDPGYLDMLREKYRAERDKRLETNRGQTLKLSGSLVHLLDDPHVEPIVRASVQKTVDVVVVGAGFAGLQCAIRMRQVGFERVCLIDKAGGVGGVWYWNRYPGAMCDTESYMYLPMLEEVGTAPRHRYSFAPEILGHAEAMAREFDLHSEALFQTAVVDLSWDETAKHWIAKTDREDEIAAQFAVLALGSLNYPKFPRVPGIQTFKGRMFHTSRWDYDYTGGDNSGHLTRLKDKVVGIVGNAASGLQAVPHLGASAKQLYVFQRTPAIIAVRGNRPTDMEWFESQQPGWQTERRKNYALVTSGRETDVDMVSDGWTLIYKALRNPKFADLPPEEVASAVELADAQLMEAVRARVDSIVKDKQVAEALKPYYRYMCKRPTFHDEYLETFNRANVMLVDTQGRGLERVYEHGVVANGVTYELDCLIFATGFEVFGAAYRAEFAGFQVNGRAGANLERKWEPGIATLFGLMSHNFPNLFFIPTGNAQSAIISNQMHMISENARHVAYIAGAVREQGAATFDVEQEAEHEWVQTIVDNAIDNSSFLAACTPGRFNYEGQPDKMKRTNSNYDPGGLALMELLEKWRADGSLRGLKVE
jgi:cyclohexanone monooxygenase